MGEPKQVEELDESEEREALEEFGAVWSNQGYNSQPGQRGERTAKGYNGT